MIRQSEGEAKYFCRKRRNCGYKTNRQQFHKKKFILYWVLERIKKIQWVLCNHRIMHRRHFLLESGTGFPLTGGVTKEGGGSDASICRVKVANYFFLRRQTGVQLEKVFEKREFSI